MKIPKRKQSSFTRTFEWHIHVEVWTGLPNVVKDALLTLVRRTPTFRLQQALDNWLSGQKR